MSDFGSATQNMLYKVTCGAFFNVSNSQVFAALHKNFRIDIII